MEWLAELSTQLDGLYIVNFDGASEDYHFTIMDKDDCEKAMGLFKKMTSHIDGYSYTCFVITGDFEGLLFIKKGTIVCFLWLTIVPFFVFTLKLHFVFYISSNVVCVI